jgi:hypothetical protein
MKILLKCSCITFKGVKYYPSTSLALVPQVFYMPGLFSLDLVPHVFYMPGDNLKVQIRKEYLDLALVKHDFIKNEWFKTYHQDDFGWNIKGQIWKEIEIHHRYQHNYSLTRGYTFTIGRSFVYGSKRSLKLFLIKGALNIRRVYKTIIFYMPGRISWMDYKFGGLVPWISQEAKIEEFEDFKKEITWKKYFNKIINESLLVRFAYYKFYNLSSLNFVYNDILEIVKTIQNINMKKGFVITDNIFNPTFYPIVSEIALKFSNEKE